MGVAELIVVRHGESTANVAREQAEASGAELIAVEARDADVALSDVGLRQAQALGSWLAALPADARPTAAWSSPYVRAHQTAQAAVAAAGSPLRIEVDERLRDKELGVLDALTSYGVRTRFPMEAERRRWLGKFYYRSHSLLELAASATIANTGLTRLARVDGQRSWQLVDFNRHDHLLVTHAGEDLRTEHRADSDTLPR